MESTAWAQEHFQKLLPANTAHCVLHKCSLKLYHEKKKPHENTIQKSCCLLWAESDLKWTEA